jgi:hypothetical protein
METIVPSFARKQAPAGWYHLLDVRVAAGCFAVLAPLTFSRLPVRLAARSAARSAAGEAEGEAADGYYQLSHSQTGSARIVSPPVVRVAAGCCRVAAPPPSCPLPPVAPST